MKINSNNEKRIPYPVKKTKKLRALRILSALCGEKKAKNHQILPSLNPQSSIFNLQSAQPPSTVHGPPSTIPIRSSNEKRIKNPSCPFVAFVVKIFPPPSALHPAFCTLQLATINLPT
jgi:hypothetical protein